MTPTAISVEQGITFDPSDAYQLLTAMALDPASSLYAKEGGKSRGTPLASAFWDGWDGKKPSYLVPKSPAHSAWLAGKDLRATSQ